MAQRIIGLDVGARNIRVAVVESTLRTVEIERVDVEPVLQVPDSILKDAEQDAGEERTPADAAADAKRREAARADAQRESTLRALRNLQGRGALEADHIVTAMPGDSVVSRILHFPFSDPKRLEQVVAFELEEYIPFELDDVVVDHCILSSDEEGTRVLASAAPLADVAELLGLLMEVGVDPRIVSLSAFAHKKIFDYRFEEEQAPEHLPCIAVVDIGHMRTDITVMNHGDLAFSRTVRRGGASILRSIGGPDADPRATERLVAAHGRVLSDEEAGADVEAQALSNALSRGLYPILRDINQTLRSHERISRDPVDRIFLAGGMAHLPGLAPFMAKVLEIPTELISELPPALRTPAVATQDLCAMSKSIGLALELIRGGSLQAINFRRGPFAYKGDFQFLVERAPALLMIFAALLVAVGGWYGVARANLIKERDHLADELSSFTKAVVGRAITDPQLAKATILAPPTKGYMDALPQRTGIWVFAEASAAVEEVRRASPPKADDDAGEKREEEALSDAMPSDALAGDASPEAAKEREYELELERFEVAGNQGMIKGQAKVLEALELFVQILRSRACFNKVTVENTDKIAFERHRGWLSFEITYLLDCKSAAKSKGNARDARTTPGKAQAGSPDPDIAEKKPVQSPAKGKEVKK